MPGGGTRRTGEEHPSCACEVKATVDWGEVASPA